MLRYSPQFKRNSLPTLIAVVHTVGNLITQKAKSLPHPFDRSELLNPAETSHTQHPKMTSRRIVGEEKTVLDRDDAPTSSDTSPAVPRFVPDVSPSPPFDVATQTLSQELI